jgi:hypothetical protein
MTPAQERLIVMKRRRGTIPPDHVIADLLVYPVFVIVCGILFCELKLARYPEVVAEPEAEVVAEPEAEVVAEPEAEVVGIGTGIGTQKKMILYSWRIQQEPAIDQQQFWMYLMKYFMLEWSTAFRINIMLSMC